MSSLKYLRSQGFSARQSGNRLVISPRHKITDLVRSYIKLHRLVILAEIAANDDRERRITWQVTRNGKSICTLSGEPMTHEEALNAARSKWIDAEVSA